MAISDSGSELTAATALIAATVTIDGTSFAGFGAEEDFGPTDLDALKLGSRLPGHAGPGTLNVFNGRAAEVNGDLRVGGLNTLEDDVGLITIRDPGSTLAMPPALAGNAAPANGIQTQAFIASTVAGNESLVSVLAGGHFARLATNMVIQTGGRLGVDGGTVALKQINLEGGTITLANGSITADTLPGTEGDIELDGGSLNIQQLGTVDDIPTHPITLSINGGTLNPDTGFDMGTLNIGNLAGKGGQHRTKRTHRPRQSDGWRRRHRYVQRQRQ